MVTYNGHVKNRNITLTLGEGLKSLSSTLQVQIEGGGEEGGGGVQEAIDIGVNVVGVYNLPKMDVMGSCDPYVVSPYALNPKP